MERYSPQDGGRPHEGRRGASEGGGELPATGPMLARANLLRIRGRWSDAAEQCVAVLRIDPSNGAAHSLLGDIYQDQGRPEEAKHWYGLALELNAGSEADRAKLSRAEEALEARQQREEWAAVIEGRSQPVATSLLIRESLQRIGAIAGAALCGMILVMATLVSVQERNGAMVDDLPGVTAASPRKPRAVSAETWREQALYRATAANAGSGIGQAVRVEVDPLTRTLTVRVFVPRNIRQGAGGGALRERVMREAYRWALAARRAASAQREPEEFTQTVRVTVVGPSEAAANKAETEFLLVAVLSRGDLVVESDVVTPAELHEFFNRVEVPIWGGDLAG